MAPVAQASRLRENRTRYVVLGMLAGAPMTGYALRQQIAHSVGHFWQESFGQLYPALRGLAAEGLVQARAMRGGPGRGSSIYSITPAGRATLERWLALPPVLEPARNELLLKVFFAGAVPAELTARNLEAVAGRVRAQQQELQAIADRWEEEVGDHHDAPYWRLTLDFGLLFARTALEWLDGAQTVLRRPRRAGSRVPECPHPDPLPPRGRGSRGSASTRRAR
jgi:DNA-binding PadR family transcriptional regulator